MQKLVTLAAFVAVAIFLGTLIYAVPKATSGPIDLGEGRVAQPAPDTPGNTPPADPTDKPDDPVDPDPTDPDAPDDPVIPATPLEPARPVLPTVEPVAVDGGDVAAFLNLRLARFRVTVPQGKYTVHVWAERWRRGDEKPDPIVLTEFGTDVDSVEVVVQMPTASQPDDGFLRVNALVARPRKPLVPTGAYYQALGKAEAFDLGSDLHLLTYTWNENGRAEGGLKDVHANHDLTIYLKARLIPGDFTPFKKPASEGGEATPNAPLTAPDTEIP